MANLIASGIADAWWRQSDQRAAVTLMAFIDGFNTKRGRSGSAKAVSDNDAAALSGVIVPRSRQVTAISLVEAMRALYVALERAARLSGLDGIVGVFNDWAKARRSALRTGT